MAIGPRTSPPPTDIKTDRIDPRKPLTASNRFAFKQMRTRRTCLISPWHCRRRREESLIPTEKPANLRLLTSFPAILKHPPRSAFIASGALLLFALTSCAPKETKLLLEPAQALGTVLAEETARAAGAKKQVVLILPQWAAQSTAGESFKAALKKQGVSIAFTLSADVGDRMGRNPIGLKPADFLEALEKGKDSGVIVSLAGVPALGPQDIGRLGSGHPAVLVVATSSLGNALGVPSDQLNLASLLDAKIIQLAIIDSEAAPAAPPPAKMDATRQSFNQHYRILLKPD